jgi:hypothetical protein
LESWSFSSFKPLSQVVQAIKTSTIMSTTFIFWFLALLPFIDAIPTLQAPTAGLQKRCNNILQNPSFESGLSPWLDIGFGSWIERSVMTSAQGGHDGKYYYFGQSNAVVSHTSFTLSQSGLSISAGTTVDCSAWVASDRLGNVGSTSVQLFINEASCGGPVYLGTNPWVKVGGKVTVDQDSHTFSIVVISDVTGSDGSKTWVDDAFVGMGC